MADDVDRLAKIRRRARDAAYESGRSMRRWVAVDVPWLLAEVDRLRERLSAEMEARRVVVERSWRSPDGVVTRFGVDRSGIVRMTAEGVESIFRAFGCVPADEETASTFPPATNPEPFSTRYLERDVGSGLRRGGVMRPEHPPFEVVIRDGVDAETVVEAIRRFERRRDAEDPRG